MSDPSGYQLSGNAAEMYERYATQYMGPWARDLVALAALKPGQRVLDLACGTGVVARIAATELGPTGQVTGLDFNAGMLAVARALAAVPGATIRWVEGSAMAMDFPDASFDAILCQQGLQFFPDGRAALREMRRTLVPGGRALLSVWASESPYHLARGEALERFAGADIASKYRASRDVAPDAGMLRRMLVETGFRRVEIRPRRLVIHLPSIETFVVGHLGSSPVAGAIAAMGEERRSEFGRYFRNALRQYADGDGVAVPEEVNVAIGLA